MPRGGVSGYAVINARVRAMSSNLLTSQQWTNLCQTPDSRSLVESLNETAYHEYLVNVDEKELTPRRAVYQIKHRIADAYLTVIRLALAHTRPLLMQLYRHFELDNLKAVFRGIISGASWERVRFVLFPFGSDTVLPAQAMVEAGSVEAAVALLHDTPYYDTLSHALKRYAAEQSLFPLEVALDLNYFRQLWNEVKQLTGDDRNQSLRVVGSLLDMNNLMWAIRYRVYHHLSEEEIINYTLPFGHRVQDEDIRAIAAGADISQVVARAYPTLPEISTLLQDPRTDLPMLELHLQRYLGKQCKAVFAGYPFHVGIPLAFVTLTELEVQDLIVIIEAKAVQMPPERFQPLLLAGCAPQ